MDAKKNLYPLIVVFFILGLVIGYAIHKPETIEKIQYVDRIVNATATPVTTSPSATASPTPAESPTATPIAPDFTVKEYYDPAKDKVTVTMELVNRATTPDTVRIMAGETVLIKIIETSLQSRLTLILNSSYTKNLGTSGAVVVTFNKKGSYSVKAIIPSSDPSIIPIVYTEREGKIIVN